jgi:hypothetical protein
VCKVRLTATLSNSLADVSTVDAVQVRVERAFAVRREFTSSTARALVCTAELSLAEAAPVLEARSADMPNRCLVERHSSGGEKH